LRFFVLNYAVQAVDNDILLSNPRKLLFTELEIKKFN